MQILRSAKHKEEEWGDVMKKEFIDFTKEIERRGYRFQRCRGSHFIYSNNRGHTVSVNKDLNKMVERRLMKEIEMYMKGNE